ncbi:hypothetical protein N9L47_13365 [Rhodobacteraceae bacterium]|nr:hypothetical protein [Paracoccaceae bacterium]
MQRAKHADRKRRTRALILIGVAAERAKATHLDPEEVEAVLTHYVRTGGEPELKTFVAKRISKDVQDLPGGSEATRQRQSTSGEPSASTEIVQ